MLVNFRPAFLPRRINIGKVGWLVSLRKKTGCEKLCGVSARNEFKKYLAGLLVKKLKDATMKIKERNVLAVFSIKSRLTYQHWNQITNPKNYDNSGSSLYQVKIALPILEPNNQTKEL